MSPAELIAHIREEHGGSRSAAPTREWLDRYLARLPESQRPVARAVWERRQGKTVGEALDEMIMPYLKELGQVLTEREWELAGHTWFALLPTFQFNAHCGRTPRGDRIVVLHQTLVHTVSLWSHWYLRVVELQRDPLLDGPEQLLEVLMYFAAVWRGRPPEHDPENIYPATQDSWELDDALTTATILFVLAHELGHIALDHRKYGNDPAANHAREFEADRFALDIVIRHAFAKRSVDEDTYFTKFRLFAPLFAVAVTSFISGAESRTHPAAARRRERLIEAMPAAVRAILGKDYEPLVDELDGDAIYEHFDRNSRGIFRTLGVYRSLAPDAARAYAATAPAWLGEELPQGWG